MTTNVSALFGSLLILTRRVFRLGRRFTDFFAFRLGMSAGIVLQLAISAMAIVDTVALSPAVWPGTQELKALET
jgi:hypothetical protein